MRPAVVVLLVAVCSMVVDPTQGLAGAPDDVEKLTVALDELDRWTGAGANGRRWRRFLRSAQLRLEMEKGGAADPAILARALQQYRSGVAGLDKKRFVEVALELESWLAAVRGQYAGDLARLAWAARGDHVPITDADVARLRTELTRAGRQLESRLAGNRRLAEGWKTYLKWTLLEPHFNDSSKAVAAITSQSLRDLDAVLRRLRSNHPGLEHPVFVRTAHALERFRELAFWNALGQRRDTRARYASFLSELEKQLIRNQENPTVESTRQVGKVLGLLHHLGDSPILEQRVREAFDRPNVSVEISTAAIKRLAERPVGEPQPVRDVILGAQVRGTAYSSGYLSVRTLPAANHIAIELRLDGNIASRTSSYKKPVRVGSLGSTHFIATKNLQISDQRFVAMPAAASATTQTRIRSVKKTGGKLGHRLIEKIARKKVAESKSQAEWIAARHAERQLAKKFDSQVVDALYQARQNYDQRFHAPLERIAMFPDYLQMASHSSGIRIKTRLASTDQISTDRLPPGVRVGNDITLQIHESAVNNFLPHLLAGVQIEQDQESEPPRITGDTPAWLKKLGRDPQVKAQFVPAESTSQSSATVTDASPSQRLPFKPWAFLLNSEHPVSVSFDDQQVTLRIRIAELKTIEDGEESIRKNWDFLVTYLIARDGNRVVLRRQGVIETLPTGFDPQWFGDPRWNDKLTGQQAGVRKNLEANINRRAAEGGGFPLEIPLPPIALPLVNGTKLTLNLQQLEGDEGWLTLGYRLP